MYRHLSGSRYIVIFHHFLRYFRYSPKCQGDLPKGPTSHSHSNKRVHNNIYFIPGPITKEFDCHFGLCFHSSITFIFSLRVKFPACFVHIVGPARNQATNSVVSVENLQLPMLPQLRTLLVGAVCPLQSQTQLLPRLHSTQQHLPRQPWRLGPCRSSPGPMKQKDTFTIISMIVRR